MPDPLHEFPPTSLTGLPYGSATDRDAPVRRGAQSQAAICGTFVEDRAFQPDELPRAGIERANRKRGCSARDEISSRRSRGANRGSFAACCVASVLGLLACQPRTPGTDRPLEDSASLQGSAAGLNLLLISIDTLRADRLGAFGHPSRDQSPNIDALAARGTRFQQTSAPRGLTWPSLATLLTGQYPSSHGLVQNGYEFADDQLTLPHLMAAQGYETAAVLSNMCKANHSGWQAFECAGGVDQRVNRKALAWLDSRESTAPTKPFFLWVHYFGAHGPYYNGGDRAARANPDYTGPVVGKKHALNRIMTEQIPLTEGDIEQLDLLYDSAVQGTDHFVGELLAGVAERVDMSRTVIVLTADHGEDLYDHNGYLYHACSPYQSGLHVPLLIVLPPSLDAPGGDVEQPVELSDVLPTLADLFSFEPPTCVDGRSLLRYLHRPQRAGSGKAALSEYGTERIATVRLGDWKLIVNPDEHRPLCLPGAPPDLYPIEAIELYDLSSDPAESANVFSEHPERVAQLLEVLTRREAEKCGGSVSEQELSEELRRELEGLGYVVN